MAMAAARKDASQGLIFQLAFLNKQDASCKPKNRGGGNLSGAEKIGQQETLLLLQRRRHK